MSTETDYYEEMLRACNEAIEGGSDDLFDRFERANALAALGRHEEAIRDLDLVLAADPHYDAAEGMAGAAWHNRGNSLLALERFGEAADSFAQALAHGARGDAAAGSLENQAEALARGGRLADAQAVVERLWKREPHEPGFVLDRGRVLVWAGKVDEGLALVEREFPQAEDLPPAALAAVHMLLGAGQPGTAFERLEARRAAHADEPYFWLIRADVADDLSRPDDVIDSLEHALALDPDTAEEIAEEFAEYADHPRWESMMAGAKAGPPQPVRRGGAASAGTASRGARSGAAPHAAGGKSAGATGASKGGAGKHAAAKQSAKPGARGGGSAPSKPGSASAAKAGAKPAKGKPGGRR